jgi:anti-anti-sigma factor
MGAESMTDDEVTIPLVDHQDGPALPAPAPAARPGGSPPTARKTSLEADRLGLLGSAAPDLSGDQRMEEWIASQLDLDIPSPLAPQNAWHRIIAGLPGARQPRKKSQEPPGPEASLEGWARFRVAYRRGFTIVRLVDRTLVRNPQIQELAADLFDLIEAGNHRVVLNFQAVERLASWVVVVLSHAQKLCDRGDGGALKICALRPELAEILPIAGVGTRMAAHPDETSAIESPWPVPSGPRPLPLDILTALLRSADIRPVCGGAPSGELDHSAVEEWCDSRLRTSPPPRIRTAPEPSIWLSVQIGGSAGRVVPLVTERFVIGRDSACQLRLGSPMVSKRHACLERRGELVVLRDLESTNGTIVNGRPIHGRELPLQDGDRFQVGPVICTLHVQEGARRAPVRDAEDLIADWLQPQTGFLPAEQSDELTTVVDPASKLGAGPEAELVADADAESESEPEHRIKVDVIQDVLVVTPRSSALDDAETIERLRESLVVLFDQPVPRQVVVNLEYIGRLTGHAIGILLAHHLRLDRVGGALRICQARARIMAVLHQVQLTMLVECYPTLDEAVLAAWPGTPKHPGANE